MVQSKFKRPVGFEGVQNDPEESYRAGFQHGAREVLHYLQTVEFADLDRVHTWVNNEILEWRHDTEAEPVPPSLK